MAGGFGGGDHGEDASGDVFGGADGAEDVGGGFGLFFFFVIITEALLEPFAFNEAWGDGVDADGGAEGAGEGFGHHDEGGFAGAVGDGAAGADDAGDAGDVDDDAAFANGEGFAGGAGGLEWAFEVDGEDAVPVFIAHGVEVGEVDEAGGAGVVDEDVEAAECFDCFLNHGAAGGIVGDISLGDDGLGAGRAALVGDGLGAVGGLVVVDGHAAAGLGELQRGGGADAAGGAGDEGGFGLEIHRRGISES